MSVEHEGRLLTSKECEHFWQPMGTAPKTGHILGWDPHFKRPFVMMWNIPDNKFLASDSVFKDEEPVAWMPLPKGPEA